MRRICERCSKIYDDEKDGYYLVAKYLNNTVVSVEKVCRGCEDGTIKGSE